MSMGIKLFLTLVVILSVTNMINAQFGLPQVKKCHLLKNTIVHKTGFCELRKCHNIDDSMACHIFKGIELCDCKRGYLFNQCTGECVRPKQCPKVAGGKPVCK